MIFILVLIFNSFNRLIPLLFSCSRFILRGRWHLKLSLLVAVGLAESVRLSRLCDWFVVLLVIVSSVCVGLLGDAFGLVEGEG